MKTNTLIPSTRRTNCRTVAAVQAALDNEYLRPVCRIGRESNGLTVEMLPGHDGRKLAVIGFVTGFLASLSR
jgi:hypothetical protein